MTAAAMAGGGGSKMAYVGVTLAAVAQSSIGAERSISQATIC